WNDLPVRMFLADIDRCTDNSGGLHLSNFWIGNSQTAATVTHHWVKLMQGSDNIVDLFNGDVHLFGQFFYLSLGVWNKLVERWVEEADGNRKSLHCLIDRFKVALLHWEQFCKSGS